MKKLLFLLAVIASLTSEAQTAAPAPSPGASVSSVVGLTNVKIDYSRPRARGRKIFGAGTEFIVPYGAIWRTGANTGTKISFSDDVTIEGLKVPKGEYLIFTWPGAKEWTISLYKDLALGGNTADYKKENELVNFKVKSEQLTRAQETFTVNIDDIAADNKTAKVSIAWENTIVRFTIGVNF